MVSVLTPSPPGQPLTRVTTVTVTIHAASSSTCYVVHLPVVVRRAGWPDTCHHGYQRMWETRALTTSTCCMLWLYVLRLLAACLICNYTWYIVYTHLTWCVLVCYVCQTQLHMNSGLVFIHCDLWPVILVHLYIWWVLPVCSMVTGVLW